MRGLLILAVAVIPAVAQNPVVHLTNATHPASREFQVGDRFEILITGAANQSISGRTDWGPIIGRTNTSGRWSASGQFEKGDLGDWSEVWTEGGKVANPALHFSIGAPCLTGGSGL